MKYVYSFNEGSKDMRNLLGGKGANLAEMTKIGTSSSFWFTITTDACKKLQLMMVMFLVQEIID